MAIRIKTLLLFWMIGHIESKYITKNDILLYQITKKSAKPKHLTQNVP